MATGTGIVVRADDELTDRQREILGVIVRWIDDHGNPPVIRELMAEAMIKSPNGVMCHLHALKRKGYIDWDATKSRSIKVVKGGHQPCPHCGGTGHLKPGGES